MGALEKPVHATVAPGVDTEKKLFGAALAVKPLFILIQRIARYTVEPRNVEG